VGTGRARLGRLIRVSAPDIPAWTAGMCTCAAAVGSALVARNHRSGFLWEKPLPERNQACAGWLASAASRAAADQPMTTRKKDFCFGTQQKWIAVP